MQAVPLGGGPVVIQRGHELAAVRPHGLRRGPPERGRVVGRLARRRRGVGGGLEDVDVQAALGVEPPQQRPAVRGQPPVHLRQARAQRVQLPPQVGPGLGVRGIRPELGGDILAALRRAPVHQQEAEQGDRARRPQREHDRAVERDPDLAEQRYVEHDLTPQVTRL